MATLYEISGEMMMLMEMMEEDPNSEVIKDTLEGLGGELEQKAEGYCKAIAEYDHTADSLSMEIERLQAKKVAAERNAKRLKDALFMAMLHTNTPKIKGKLFSLSIRNNAVSLDKVPEKLPAKYLVPAEPKVDRKLLLSDVKAGIVVEGVTTKQTQSLMIK